MSDWQIYYRGSLSSCNYSCGYCPFAKTKNTREELRQDQNEVERFTDWVSEQKSRSLSILFTPWGEALGHRYYRRALVELSRLPQVRRVCIQTNLSAPLIDFEGASKDSLSLWVTFHPGETSLEKFLGKCRELDAMNVRYSVGIVGMRDHLNDMEELRRKLSDSVYLWVNAYKREPNYYKAEDLVRIRRVDRHFDINNQRYPSLGKACRAGESHFTIDGSGDVRSCHFVDQVIGNIFRDDISQLLTPRLCPVESCGCYIGYIHRPELQLGKLYGDDLLGRIPVSYSNRVSEPLPGKHLRPL